MNTTWKTIRVFISSTFRDMQAGQDHLVRFVFPKLRQELLQRRIHLVDGDLRWGVTSEQDALSVADLQPGRPCHSGKAEGGRKNDESHGRRLRVLPLTASLC
jgi:hypothetical protein